MASDKPCTPEEMEQPGHEWTIKHDPLWDILNRPRCRCIIEPVPGKKMKVVPLGEIPSMGSVANLPRKVIVHKVQTTNLMSIRQRRWFAWRGVLITARRDATKLRKFINKELKKQRRRQMFRYREITAMGGAVVSALVGIQFLLIALKLAKVWELPTIWVLFPVLGVIAFVTGFVVTSAIGDWIIRKWRNL